VLEAPCPPARGLQPTHGVVGIGAERAAAVGHNLAIGRQLGQPILELVDRDGARAFDVPGFELLRRTDVDEHDVDALLVGDAGRPDIRTHGEHTVEEMARALQLGSEDAFVEALTQDIPPAPEQQAAIAAANRTGRPLAEVT
jgi:hypothetical protein